MDNISIVVPLLNKGPHVERVLNSVLCQTVQDFEVIVVDGGSSDDGPDIVETFVNKDSRIRLIRQEGKGVSDARNQGISESKFKLIAFLDADDEWMPNYLETILRLREKYPDAGLYATSIKTDFIDNVLMGINAESRKIVPDEGLVPNYFKIYKNGDYLFGTSSVTIPSKIFSEIGGFQTDFWWGEDTDMWCRIALKYPIAYSSQVCAIYYQNVVNSACRRKEAVDIHPFVKTAREALKLGKVPAEVINDLDEYIHYIDLDTAIHNLKVGDKSLALNLLTKNNTSLSSKIKLLQALLSTYSKDNFIISSKPVLEKNTIASK